MPRFRRLNTLDFNLVYNRPRPKDAEGNIFTCVCLFTGGGGGVTPCSLVPGSFQGTPWFLVPGPFWRVTLDIFLLGHGQFTN